jgi:hypothetical protein
VLQLGRHAAVKLNPESPLPLSPSYRQSRHAPPVEALSRAAAASLPRAERRPGLHATCRRSTTAAPPEDRAPHTPPPVEPAAITAEHRRQKLRPALKLRRQVEEIPPPPAPPRLCRAALAAGGGGGREVEAEWRRDLGLRLGRPRGGRRETRNQAGCSWKPPLVLHVTSCVARNCTTMHIHGLL